MCIPYRHGCGLLLSVVLGLPYAAGAATVYRHVDADGRVSYSDAPAEGAVSERIELPEPNAMPATPPEFRAQPDAEVATEGYARVDIVEPLPEASIRSNDGSLRVRVATTPELRAGHRLQVLLDGSPVAGGVSAEGVVALSGLDRGAHQVAASVLDADGKALANSETTVFYIQRASIATPPPRAGGATSTGAGATSTGGGARSTGGGARTTPPAPGSGGGS